MSATYAVGRGKPPVHSRFQKGQSGNPSGKPGPEKSLKGLLRRTVEDALARNFDSANGSRPANVLDRAVHNVVLEAAKGNAAAMRLLLKLMDDTEKAAPKRGRNEDDWSPFSLHQGKKQGSEKNPNGAGEKILPEQAVAKKRRGAAGKNRKAAGNDSGARGGLGFYFATSFLDTLGAPELDRLAAIQVAVEKADAAGDEHAFAEGQAAFEAFLETLNASQIDAYLTSTGAIPPPAA